jgi:hypothetical protein
MSQLVRRRFLKAGGDGSDRVERAEDPANGAIFSIGIRTLQDDQKRILGLGVEDFL